MVDGVNDMRGIWRGGVDFASCEVPEFSRLSRHFGPPAKAMTMQQKKLLTTDPSSAATLREPFRTALQKG
jgi:hypothetical protein